MREIIRLLKGHHEPQEEKVFHEVLKHINSNATMIELGSNWSYYSLWFKRHVPHSRTYMIEPEKTSLEVGKTNFKINGLQGEFFQYFIGSESKIFKKDLHHTPTISVDEFLAAHSLKKVDILHSDIQGSELDMLNGAVNSIKDGRIRFIFISTHHHTISGDPITHQKCLEFLEKNHAVILAEHRISESYSGDGLIVAWVSQKDGHIPDIQISRNRSCDSLFREVECDLDDTRRELERTKYDLDETRRELERIHTELNSIFHSLSWRLTRPLRLLKVFMKKCFRKE